MQNKDDLHTTQVQEYFIIVKVINRNNQNWLLMVVYVCLKEMEIPNMWQDIKKIYDNISSCWSMQRALCIDLGIKSQLLDVRRLGICLVEAERDGNASFFRAFS